MVENPVQLQEFVRFNDLPAEIRLNIWGLAIQEPRFIHIESDLVRKVPSVLHVNFESRKEALRSYSLMHIPRFPLGQAFQRTIIGKHEEFINLAQDTICFFPRKTEHDGAYTHIHQQETGKIIKHCETRGVQHFATDHWLWGRVVYNLGHHRCQSQRINDPTLEGLPTFGSSSTIKTITLCPPFESSTTDENRKRLVQLHPDSSVLVKKLEHSTSTVLRWYDRVNPQDPWSWAGMVRYALVKSDTDVAL
jgi:hypothetical protein